MMQYCLRCGNCLGVAAVIVGLWVEPAFAHAFDAGADSYAQFLEGTSVILAWPATLLPIAALGVAISLWKTDGLLSVWPAYLIGLAAGILVAPLTGPWIVAAFAALGAITGSLAALLSRHNGTVMLLLSGLTGVIAMAVSLEGHGLFELPFFIHLGIFFAANLALAIAAGLARLALDWVAAGWMRIAVRVVASWTGAALVIIVAFAVR